jgi:hypothetical protein
METQLIHANLDALHISMENLAAEECKAHAEVSGKIGQAFNSFIEAHNVMLAL